MDEWQIDVAQQTARHTSGLTLTFEGRPGTRHFSGTPSHVPDGMPSLDMVRLIREGYQAFENAWPTTPDVQTSRPESRGARSAAEGVQVRHRRPRRRTSG